MLPAVVVLQKGSRWNFFAWNETMDMEISAGIKVVFLSPRFRRTLLSLLKCTFLLLLVTHNC